MVDPKNRDSFPLDRAPPALSQTSRDRPLFQYALWRAVANEHDGGEPAVRAVDASGAGEGVPG